jgi:DNA invertase Pin-like site-specific DNA recombinase
MSIKNQRDMLESYCIEKGWKIYDIYVDDGFTGTNFDRPDFQRMISDIKKGHINVVLTKDLSRLGRNYVMTGQYTDFFFPEHGVRYVAINDSYDSDKEDNDIAPFRNVLNEMYARDISRKVRSVRITSAKQGKFMGSKAPYGYMKSSENKHMLVIDSVAANVVRRLFREFAAGDTGRRIACRLNAEGIDSPATYYYKQTGKRSTNSISCQQWGSSTVMQLFRNHAYIGQMVQGKRKVTSFKTQKRHSTKREEWIVVEGTHEPIINSHDWECVQRRLQKVATSQPRNAVRNNKHINEVNLFAGMIRCADCGATMAFNHRVGKKGKVKSFYRCSRYCNNGEKACTTHTIDSEMLKHVLLHDIQHYAKTAVRNEQELFNRLLAFTGKSIDDDNAASEKTLSDTEKRIDFVKVAGKNLFEEKVKGSMPEAMCNEMLTNYQSEIEKLTDKASELRNKIQETRNSKADVQRWLNLVKECSEINTLDRETVYQLIDQVSVHEKSDECGIRKQQISVKYNFVGNIGLN